MIDLRFDVFLRLSAVYAQIFVKLRHGGVHDGLAD
jgi:hypothetical protein